MLKIFCGSNCIHDPDPDPNNYDPDEGIDITRLILWNISLTKKINEPDSLSFVIHDEHPYSNNIYPNCQEIRIDYYEYSSRTTTETIFYGRVLSTSINIHGERTVTCEGELGYLLDSTIPAFAKKKVLNSEAIQYILKAHNSQVTGSAIDKKVHIGSGSFDFPYIPKYDVNADGFIFAQDANMISKNASIIMSVFYPESAAAGRRRRLAEKIIRFSARLDYDDLKQHIYNWSSDGTERALDIIKKNLTDIYGGVLSIRHEDGAKYLDYSQINKGSQPDANTPKATLDNILDITYEKSAEEKFTMVYPVGAEITETDSLEVKALEGCTWLAFGDGNTVCKPTPGVEVDISNGNAYENNFFDPIANCQIAKIAGDVGSDSYTGYLASSGTRYQLNRFTTHNGSYVSLLTKAAKMRTITMAEETETIFKHGGHREKINGTTQVVQNWSSDGVISTNQDKSVVERLFDIFGPAKIMHTSESWKIKNSENQVNRVETDVAVKMVLQYDIDNNVDTDHWTKPLTGIRTCDFVTVAVGLNDWLNADSILGTNEMGRKFSSYIDAAASTAANLHKYTSSTAIDDYMEKTYETDPTSGETILDPKHESYFDEDGKRIEFKRTLYWQIRFLCMYLKACFPKSHIIIFSSFGSKSEEKTGGTDEQNKVGMKGWYADISGKRTRHNFYTEAITDPYMKANESTDNSGDWDGPYDTEPANPGGPPHDYVKIGTKYYKKVHINGQYTKSTRTICDITAEGQNPNQEASASDDYLAWAKVSRQEPDPTGDSSGGSGGTSGGDENVPQPGDDSLTGTTGTNGEVDLSETGSGSGETSTKSVPYLAYLWHWNSESKTDIEGKFASAPSGTTFDNFENAPEIICNPYEVLKENSYSISDLNSAINEVCEEMGIVFVDSIEAAGISVDNYADIKNIKTVDHETDPDEDIEVVKIGHTSTVPYDNISLLETDESGEEIDTNGTKAGTWGESFINGAYLNDRGQLAMAKAVRNAMIECLVSDGTIENVEHLTITGKEHPYYAPIQYDIVNGEEEYTDLDFWRAMVIKPSDNKLVKIDGVYDSIGQIKRTKVIVDGEERYIYKDKDGFGQYDLTDYFGDYNPRAFEKFDIITSGENANMALNSEITATMVPTAPADPIVSVAQFDDITDPQELFYAAAEYLYNNYGQNVVNITVKLIDMHIVDLINRVDNPHKAIDIGNVVLVSAENYGLSNSPFVVDAITMGEDPSNTTVTLKSVGSRKFANEMLAANPYGSYGNRPSSILHTMFTNFSELFDRIAIPISKIGGG